VPATSVLTGQLERGLLGVSCGLGFGLDRLLGSSAFVFMPVNSIKESSEHSMLGTKLGLFSIFIHFKAMPT
jgi:hypothetical protein